MMLPSTVPLLRLDHAAARSFPRSVANASGYLAVWIAFGCFVLLVDMLGLGVMSVAWMVVVGVAILVEKVTPIGVAASLFISVVLAAGAFVWAL